MHIIEKLSTYLGQLEDMKTKPFSCLYIISLEPEGRLKQCTPLCDQNP